MDCSKCVSDKHLRFGKVFQESQGKEVSFVRIVLRVEAILLIVVDAGTVQEHFFLVSRFLLLLQILRTHFAFTATQVIENNEMRMEKKLFGAAECMKQINE